MFNVCLLANSKYLQLITKTTDEASKEVCSHWSLFPFFPFFIDYILAKSVMKYSVIMAGQEVCAHDECMLKIF